MPVRDFKSWINGKQGHAGCMWCDWKELSNLSCYNAAKRSILVSTVNSKPDKEFFKKKAFKIDRWKYLLCFITTTSDHIYLLRPDKNWQSLVGGFELCIIWLPFVWITDARLMVKDLVDRRDDENEVLRE